MDAEIIIIGAGAAGLMAAHELAKAGVPALILEARDRIGGRIHTVYEADGSHMEAGAEFIHGSLPMTFSLLRDAGLSYTAAGGNWISLKGGESRPDNEESEWTAFLKQAKELQHDMPLQDFLAHYFPGSRYAGLQDKAIGFAEGYDAADASRVSVKALYAEWSAGPEDQYRIDRGYMSILDYLLMSGSKAGSRVLFGQTVGSVSTSGKGVVIETEVSTFHARKLIVTLPLGVLQQNAVRMPPAPEAFRDALNKLGFGDVIKFLFRFKEAFWEKDFPGLGFLLTGAEVPTWWTQAPAGHMCFTGWIAGRPAKAHARYQEPQLQELALSALARIFSMEKSMLEGLMETCRIANWSSDPYTRGAYAYDTVGGAAARSVLAAPLAGRIYFAGEYLYEGPAMGTVEAAFSSGADVARNLIKDLV